MPAQPMGWFKEQITDASQMDGLKYRTVGLAADVLMEMGMSVVQLPGGEIQPAMKSGLIDAAEFNNPTSDKDFGMQDVSKHYHLGSFHQSQNFLRFLLIRKSMSLCLRNFRLLNMPLRLKTQTFTGIIPSAIRRFRKTKSNGC